MMINRLVYLGVNRPFQPFPNPAGCVCFALFGDATLRVFKPYQVDGPMVVERKNIKGHEFLENN